MKKFKRFIVAVLISALLVTPFNAFGADYYLEWFGVLGATVEGETSSFPSGIVDGNATGLNFDGDIIAWQSGNLTTQQVSALGFNFTLNGDFSSGDTVTFNYNSMLGGIAFNTANLTINENGNETELSLTSSEGSFTYTFSENCTSISINIDSTDLRKSSTSTTPSTRFKLTFSVETEEKGLLKSILDWIKQIPTKIGEFFTNLINNLQTLFDNVGQWFSELGDKINGFFQNLGDSISGFFEKLWNRIYWGNENGESEYEPPVFSSGLDDALDKIDEYITQLDDTNTEIENAKNESVSYVEQATSVINSLFGVFPSVLIALVVFGVVFIFCRKVVGR